MTLLGIMQDKPLLISDIIQYAGKYHSTGDIISRDAGNGEHRYTYGDAASRAQKLARVLLRWKIAPGDRVATIAMNHHRHFELFYGVSGFGAVLHTVNPRLFGEQIVYICNHAEDRVLFFDSQYLPLVLSLSSKLKTIERYVILDPQDDDESVASQLPGFTTFETALAWKATTSNGHHSTNEQHRRFAIRPAPPEIPKAFSTRIALPSSTRLLRAKTPQWASRVTTRLCLLLQCFT